MVITNYIKYKQLTINCAAPTQCLFMVPGAVKCVSATVGRDSNYCGYTSVYLLKKPNNKNVYTVQIYLICGHKFYFECCNLKTNTNQPFPFT
jgi:hypothetical protein